MEKKPALRKSLLAARSAVPADLRQRWNAEIGARIVAWWEAHQVPTLGVYWPIRGEPDLRSAYEELNARGVRLALPVVVAKDAPLGFAEWTPGDALVKDALGVSIPAQHAVLMQPEALLIPCVGFNATRIRLGYGGGFYDRTLALAPRPFALGIAYGCALAAFDADPHDVGLDMIVTETGCISE
jgi:5-formyltetrahydrofolate cyclo-ligase